MDKVSFEIRKGQKIAIVGENSSRKTTLVKLLCGLYKVTDGSIKNDYYQELYQLKAESYLIEYNTNEFGYAGCEEGR